MKIQARNLLLEPQEKTGTHNHHEAEIWHILAGQGCVETEGQPISVTRGDTIYHQPFKQHTIRNTSAHEKLHFISYWWNDFSLLNQALDQESQAKAKLELPEPSFILPSFPTPNGNLHLGHLAGPYIAADIYKRYRELLGQKTYYLLGTVGHQTQVGCKGRQLGLSFYETAEKYSSEIIETLLAAEIHPDVFVRPRTAKHYSAVVQDFFLKLYENKHLVFRTEKTAYCDHCDKYLFEAQVVGACPICNAANAGGNECENCAHLHADKDLLNACCTVCRNPSTLKDLRRIYLPLEPFRERLLNYYKSSHITSRLRSFIEQVFQKPLPEIPISYLSETGIAIPLPGYEEQRVYSLFELAPRYVTAIQALIEENELNCHWLDLCKKYSTKLFFGYDNAFLRAIIFPAVLMAYDPNIKLPDLQVSNEFYQLDGAKFSTSRNHALWGSEMLKHYPADWLRFYLAYTRPEQQASSFTESTFVDFIKHHFQDRLTSWLQILGQRLKLNYAGEAPEPGAWSAEAKVFYRNLRDYHQAIHYHYQDEAFSPQKCAQLILDLMAQVIDFSKATSKSWQTPATESLARTYLALELMAARSLALLLYPITPQFATQLWKKLGYAGELLDAEEKTKLDWLPTGQKGSLHL